MRQVAGRLRLDLAQYRELEAFAQFGSELDQATQSALGRGERMVATLNQPQYQPWALEEQVTAIYAGIHGWLDKVPVPQVPRFHDELREHLRTERSILEAIRDSGELSDEIEQKLAGRARAVRRRVRGRGGEGARRLRPAGEPPDIVASVQDLKRRIGSVRNTRKITRAMELVAAAKLRRAELRIKALRPYAETMNELIAGVGRAFFLGAPTTARAAGDGGDRRDRPAHGRPRPCRRVQRPDPAAGVRARATLQGEGRPSAGSPWARGAAPRSPSAVASSPASTGFTDQPAYSDAQAIAHRGPELFTEGEVDGDARLQHLRLRYLTQRVTEQDVLPISPDILETDEEEREADTLRGDFIFEPEPEEIMQRLLPVYVETQIYRALLESTASEQGARMTAMRNASNAGADRQPHTADEPRPPGRDHAGDPRGRRRRGGLDLSRAGDCPQRRTVTGCRSSGRAGDSHLR